MNVDGYNKYISQIFYDLYLKNIRYDTQYTDIFSSSLTSSHACWNKFCSIVGTEIDGSPKPDWAEWWEVLTLGVDSRAVQIAWGCYGHQRCMYIRYKHDSTWSSWDRLISASCLSYDETSNTLTINI